MSMTDDRRPYDPVPDLGALLAGLQVLRSLPLAADAFGTALEPYDRIRDALRLPGWPDAAACTGELRHLLQAAGSAQAPGRTMTQ